MNNPTWKAAFVVSLRLEQTQRIGAEEGWAPADPRPLLAGSAAALLLVQLLKRKAARRRSTRSGHA